jgi:hypothetical protein
MMVVADNAVVVVLVLEVKAVVVRLLLALHILLVGSMVQVDGKVLMVVDEVQV